MQKDSLPRVWMNCGHLEILASPDLATTEQQPVAARTNKIKLPNLRKHIIAITID